MSLFAINLGGGKTFNKYVDLSGAFYFVVNKLNHMK